MRTKIHEQLTPEQGRRMDEMLRERMRRLADKRQQEGFRPGNKQPGEFAPSRPRPTSDPRNRPSLPPQPNPSADR